MPGLAGRSIPVPAGDPHRALAAIAEVQHGRVARSQLSAAGWSEKAIRTAMRKGQLQRVHSTVYAVGHQGEIAFGAEMGALLSIGSDAVLCAASVLRAHGVLIRDPREPIDVTTTTGRRAASHPGVTCHRFTGLEHARVVFIGRLPGTTVERALLDASDTLTGDELARAVDEALARRLTSRTKIRELVTAIGAGRRGAARLEALADPDRRTTITKQEAAKLALELIRAAGLPEPDTEVMIGGYPADFFFREAGVVFEVDSFAFHGVVKHNFERDRTRDRVHRRLGLVVVRATADDLTQRPLAVMADLAMTIAERCARRAA